MRQAGGRMTSGAALRRAVAEADRAVRPVGPDPRQFLRGERIGAEHIRPVASQAWPDAGCGAPKHTANPLFVELTNATESAGSGTSQGAGAWEVELELGVGVVLRVRRAAPCRTVGGSNLAVHPAHRHAVFVRRIIGPSATVSG